MSREQFEKYWNEVHKKCGYADEHDSHLHTWIAAQDAMREGLPYVQSAVPTVSHKSKRQSISLKVVCGHCNNIDRIVIPAAAIHQWALKVLV